MGREIAERGKSLVGWLLRPRRWVLITLFLALSVASLGTSFLAFGEGTLPGLGDRPLLDLNPGPLVPMGVNDCSASQCHGRPNPAAALFVAVDGVEVAPDQVVTMSPGDSFEFDFHFRDMLGDPKRFQGVGMRIVLPTAPDWRIGVGTPGHPNDWSGDGRDGKFWHPGWDRGASGEGGTPTRWVKALDRPGAYHLTLGEEPLNPAWASVVFSDRGATDPADRDGVAAHAGADAMISIPAATMPGDYPVTVSGVGHDKQNRRAMVSLTLQVRVEPFKPSTAGLGTRAQAKNGAQIYERSCSGCHGARPGRYMYPRVSGKTASMLVQSVAVGIGNMPPQGQAKGGRLSEAEIASVLVYVKREATIAIRSSPSGAPNVPHTVRSRLLCLVCHAENSIVPKPSNHKTYTADFECATCHKAPTGRAPLIPHKVANRPDCLGCHAPDNAVGVQPVTPEHGGRKNNSCSACHFTEPLDEDELLTGVMAATPTPPSAPATAAGGRAKVPIISHGIAGYQTCLTCHTKGAQGSTKPVLPGHGQGDNRTCSSCHPATAPAPTAGTPARAGLGAVTPEPEGTPTVEKLPWQPPDIPHTLENRGPCLTCHDARLGIVPLPVSHAGRPQASCQGCHKPALPGVSSPARWARPSAEFAPFIPHNLDGRAACLGCHSEDGGLLPMPPGSHVGRTSLSCLGCHRPLGEETAALPVPEDQAAPPALSAPPPVRHTLDGREACLACHTALANHEGRQTNEVCRNCHRPP